MAAEPSSASAGSGALLTLDFYQTLKLIYLFFIFFVDNLSCGFKFQTLKKACVFNEKKKRQYKYFKFVVTFFSFIVKKTS